MGSPNGKNVFSIHSSQEIKERTKTVVNVAQERQREVKRFGSLRCLLPWSLHARSGGLEGSDVREVPVTAMIEPMRAGGWVECVQGIIRKKDVYNLWRGYRCNRSKDAPMTDGSNDRCSNPLNITVALCWSLSSMSLSFLYWKAKYCFLNCCTLGDTRLMEKEDPAFFSQQENQLTPEKSEKVMLNSYGLALTEPDLCSSNILLHTREVGKEGYCCL